MNTKKKISLVLAVLMCASVLATGCKKTDEDTSLTDTSTSQISELTQMTTTEETTTETTTEETTETETESETEETTEETTETSEETTTSASETTAETTTKATTTTTAAKEWNETEISETMYTTQACYSRKKPIVGAETVAQYKKGTKVQVVAATDTGYYKLADGSFIHSDYLTDEKPASTSKTTTTQETTNETTKGGGSSNISTTYSVDYTKKYGYKSLTKEQQELYGNIVKAAENLETKVSVPAGLLSEDIIKVYLMVFNQEPQLFWLSRSIPSGYGTISLEYAISDKEQIAEIQKNIDSNVKSILSTANQYTSTFSKLKVFYDWIIKNNEFSKSEDADTCSIMNGLTPGGNLQCNGYAKSMQYLCDLAGIDSMVIIGTNPENASHAWNVVYCDNGYYNLDATWGDPENAHNFNYIRYNWFLVPDEWIKNDHINVNIFFRSNGSTIKLFDPPACTKSACNYFKAYNKEYSDVDSAVQGMYEEIAAAVKAGRNVAEIRVTSKELWDTLVTDKYFKLFQDYAREKGSDVDKLSRQKTRNEGVLVVQYDIFYK